MLAVGDSQCEMLIRVSSRTLSLASPVFASLFSDRFAEGNVRSVNGDLPRIYLPDDDPKAMLWICCTLHFHSTLQDSTDLEFIGRLAVLCNKYDLARGLHGSSNLLLQRAQATAPQPRDLTQLIYYSALFGSHVAFYASTLGLLSMAPTDCITFEEASCPLGRLSERVPSMRSWPLALPY